MSGPIHRIADDFWNIRGSYKFKGLLELGTHSSLVRKADGRFLLLDGYTLDDEDLAAVRAHTDGGEAIEAILHVHPFHTLHVEAAHQQFPGAKLYGTARHHRLFPDLPWEPEHTEDPALHARLADDLAFTVPRGVAFIPDDENLHFASVLVVHRASRAMHVDDTLMYTSLPFVGGVRFHPTLGKVLQPRAGAVAEFRAWTEELLTLCEGVDHLCAAHTKSLLHVSDGGPPLVERVREAVGKVDKVLRKHEAAHG